MKHIHAHGKCNRFMTSTLKKHLAKSSEYEEDADEIEEIDNVFENSEPITDLDDSESQQTDPRWDELKNIKDNN